MKKDGLNTSALYTISSGVYIISTSFEGVYNGQIVNTAMQISGKPEICIATSLHKDNYTAELLQKSMSFSLSVLEHDVPMTLIGTFGFHCGREFDKFSKCNYRMDEKYIPQVTDYTLATISAEVISVQEVKTHLLFIGQVVAAEVLKKGVPLTYKAYHEIKKGKSPKNAPSHVFND